VTSARKLPSGSVSLAPISAIRAIGGHRTKKRSSPPTFTGEEAIGKPRNCGRTAQKRRDLGAPMRPVSGTLQTRKIWPKIARIAGLHGPHRLGKKHLPKEEKKAGS